MRSQRAEYPAPSEANRSSGCWPTPRPSLPIADAFSAALRALETAEAEFGDIRFESRDAFTVRMANRQVESVGRMHRSGGGLRAFVADTYHAPLVGAEPGDEFRRSASSLEGAYLHPAENWGSNGVLEPGIKSMDALLAGIDRGVYVEKFAATGLNPITGAFACEVGNATLIRRGGLEEHVKYALLAGNFYDGLKAMDGIGRDPEPMPSFYRSLSCAYVPPVAFAGSELVSQA